MSSSSLLSDDDDCDDDVASASAVEEEQQDKDKGVWRPALGNEAVGERVLELVQGEHCLLECLRDKEDLVEKFLFSYKSMSKQEKKMCLLTLLSTSVTKVGVKRQRGKGQKKRFCYLLPLIGHVC